jgi:hypothetical protein
MGTPLRIFDFFFFFSVWQVSSASACCIGVGGQGVGGSGHLPCCFAADDALLMAGSSNSPTSEKKSLFPYPSWRHGLAGLASGVVATFFMMPLDFVKIQMQGINEEIIIHSHFLADSIWLDARAADSSCAITAQV